MNLTRLEGLEHFVPDTHVHRKASKIPPVHLRLDRIATPASGRSFQIFPRFTHKEFKKIIETRRCRFLRRGADLFAAFLQVFGQARTVVERQVEIFDRPRGVNP